MTDAEIFKLAITCGLDEFVNEPLLKFARAMYKEGLEDGKWDECWDIMIGNKR